MDDFGQFTEEELRRYGELRLNQCHDKVMSAKQEALEYLIWFGTQGDSERSVAAQMSDNHDLLLAVREATTARAQARCWTAALRIGDCFRADSYRQARSSAVRNMVDAHPASPDSYQIETEGARTFYALSDPDMVRWWLDECDSQPDGKQKIEEKEES